MIDHTSSAVPPGHILRAIAVEARAHPQTVRRVYAGHGYRPMSAMRVREAAARLGLPPPPAELIGGES